MEKLNRIHCIFRVSHHFWPLIDLTYLLEDIPRSIVTAFGFGPFSGRRNTYRHAYISYRLRLFSVYFRLRIRTVLLHVESSWFRTVF